MIDKKNELAYWIVLAHTKNVAPDLRYKIGKICIEKNILLSEFLDLDPIVLSFEFLLNEKEINSLDNITETVVKNSFIADNLLSEGYEIITMVSNKYPKIFYETLKSKMPIVLYAKGNTDLLNQKCIAIVGSRNASEVSLEFTDNIAKKMVEDGKVIVSGYAKGIDQQALASCLKYGGQSIIFLPQGIQTFTSGVNDLYKDIVNGSVLIVSSFFPTAGWSTGLAMARNSYIYGMADEIYIAESGDSGGTWEGAIAGLKKNQKIYIRKPDDKEDNANNLLIEKGCIPVSLNGEVL